ncbi:MAG: signal peptidase I [Anaerovoracaceae bacterium]
MEKNKDMQKETINKEETDNPIVNNDAQKVDENPKAEELDKKAVIKGVIRDIAIVLLIVFLVTFFIKPVVVKKTSMLPNLQENNYIFVSKQAYKIFGEPKRGDIIVFPHSEGDAKELYIKRVIGLPGEEVDIKDGKVFINGNELKESYLHNVYTDDYGAEAVTVPEGKVFAMGDNRTVSLDSRSPEVGFVEIKDMTGKAVLRLYPFNEIGTL